MTKPTTPGIAELLDAYVSACHVHWEDGAWTKRDIADMRAEILAHVATIEAQRDEALTLLREAGGLFRMYEAVHREKGPGHEGKVLRNKDMADRIDAIAQRGGNDA